MKKKKHLILAQRVYYVEKCEIKLKSNLGQERLNKRLSDRILY